MSATATANGRTPAAYEPDEMARSIALSLEAISQAQRLADAARDKEFSVDLSSTKSRRALARRHPMLDDGYVIETSQVEQFVDICYDFAAARKSGLYVVGSFRMGKSKAIERASAYLAQHFPFFAILGFSAERKPAQQKPQFCRAVLESWNYPVDHRQSVERVLERYLMTCAVQRGGRVVVLFVDEAQMLTVAHYRYLLEIWNALRQHGFVLVTILVGQESLDDLKQLTTALDHGAVDARFFVKRHSLDGITTEGQLQLYLAAYDTALRFPVGTGWTYTRFFLQKAVDAGFQLATGSGTFFRVLRDSSPAKGPRRTKEASAGFRLDIISAAIHSFLLDAMKDDRANFEATPERWQEALLAACDEVATP